MGCFSWMYTDTNNSKPLNIGESGYLLNPFGENYYESCYDGYGDFDGHDVYDLVAEWNKDFIPIMIKYAEAGHWICSLSDEDIKNLWAFYNDQPITCDKRWIGIMMACYDNDNMKLPYPIKITQNNIKYNFITPSLSDINQGFGEDW